MDMIREIADDCRQDIGEGVWRIMVIVVQEKKDHGEHQEADGTDKTMTELPDG